jgi:hypothetical protein
MTYPGPSVETLARTAPVRAPLRCSWGSALEVVASGGAAWSRATPWQKATAVVAVTVTYLCPTLQTPFLEYPL